MEMSQRSSNGEVKVDESGNRKRKRSKEHHSSKRAKYYRADGANDDEGNVKDDVGMMMRLLEDDNMTMVNDEYKRLDDVKTGGLLGIDIIDSQNSRAAKTTNNKFLTSYLKNISSMDEVDKNPVVSSKSKLEQNVKPAFFPTHNKLVQSKLIYKPVVINNTGCSTTDDENTGDVSSEGDITGYVSNEQTDNIIHTGSAVIDKCSTSIVSKLVRKNNIVNKKVERTYTEKRNLPSKIDIKGAREGSDLKGTRNISNYFNRRIEMTTKENIGENGDSIEGPKQLITKLRESSSKIKIKNKSLKPKSILGPNLNNVITKYYEGSNKKIKESGHLETKLMEEQSGTYGVRDKEKFSVSNKYSSEEEGKRRVIVFNNQPI